MSQKRSRIGLRELRRAALLTLQDLSQRSGLSVRTIVRYELGKIGQPRPSSIRKLAKGLGVSHKEVMNALGYLEMVSGGGEA